MKLLFVNATLAFNVETPIREPLGGTESALAYLAAQLALNGHDVSLLANLPPQTPRHLLGVRHLPIDTADSQDFFTAENFDAVIVQSAPQFAEYFKQMAPRAFHCAWLHMQPEQPDMAMLDEMTCYIDCAVFVSETQRAATRFAGASHVIGNGVAPAFENLFGSAADLYAAKQNRAAYTSTPFRGLDVLVSAMTQARVHTELDVYSSMRTYQAPDDPFRGLYETVNATPQCRYRGALGQKALAEQLKATAFLTYPATFAETYCIVALEAIAAGLKVIATDLGALKETTLGFADLTPLRPGVTRVQLAQLFARQMEKAVGEFLTQPEAWAEERFEQAQVVNRVCSWRARAREWEELLGQAINCRPV